MNRLSRAWQGWIYGRFVGASLHLCLRLSLIELFRGER